MINEDNLYINQYLISNDFFIVDNIFKDEFNIAIYFICNNKCKILIRRIDDSIGWGQDLKIKLIDIKGKEFEKISLGSCEENLKVIELYTKITLYKNENIQFNIPKIIIQTSNDNMNKNIFHYNSIMSFIDLNPDFEYKHFYDIDCREFIKNNIDNTDKCDKEEKEQYNLNKILEAFDLLIPGPLKADLFRYFYLYKNGGCYFDTKMVLRKSLSKIIKNNDKIILCNNDRFLYNGFIMIEKNNNTMYNCLKECINNILNKNKFENRYKTTGNELFNKYFKNMNNIRKLTKKGDHIYCDDNNTLILNYSYKNYYIDYFNTEKDLQFMWNNNKYFYEEAEIIGENNAEIILKYKFYYYNDIGFGKYQIIMEKNNIFKILKVNNINSNSFIKVKVIDLIKDNIHYIDVGFLINNEKIFILE
jgi:mannosyltransferase OCH1-like enzyme